MGVVYLARDTRLDRDVAVKAISEGMAMNAARLERFEREGKALAQLHHPNIAGIYGVEESDGGRYLILEFVEGMTLGERLERGPLSVEEAVEIASGIASGLEAAHEVGIIHRDLKPDNIKITLEGVVKVLDFGLAKTNETTSASDVNLSNSPTMTVPRSPTIPGAIMGTAAYMSPEQARGQRVDRRTDIWSFGVVLYEMLTGASPFVGETASDSIGAVLHKEVDLNRLPRETPQSLRRLIRRCIERDKSRRLQSIGDARVELMEIAENPSQAEQAPSPSRTGSRWPWMVAVAALALGLTAGGFAVRTMTLSPAGAHGAGLGAVTGIVQVLESSKLGDHEISVSPDGRTVLYSAKDGDDLDIFAIRIGGENPINLTPNSPGDDIDPAWSPDGERIAFASSGESGGIFVMGATGENPQRMTSTGFAPSWSPDGGKLVYTSEDVDDAYDRATRATLSVVDVRTRVSDLLETGGRSAEEAPDAVAPSWSPDGRWIAFWAVTGGIRDLFVVPAQGGERVAITNDTATDWNPVWGSASDRLFFVSDRLGTGGVWVIEIDSSTGAAASEPEPVLLGPMDVSTFSLSGDGRRLVLRTETQRVTIERSGFDRQAVRITGTPKLLHTTDADIGQVRVTDDGSWISYGTATPYEDIVVMRGDGTAQRRITNDPHRDRGAAWSPDRGDLLMYSNRGGRYEIWRVNRDGTGLRMVGSDPDAAFILPSCSPDGKVVSVLRSDESGAATVLLDVRDDGTLAPRPERIGGFGGLVWSPDGRAIAGFSRDAGGVTRVAVCDVATGEVDVLRDDVSGEALHMTHPPCWLDNDRFMFWDSRREAVAVVTASDASVSYVEDEAVDAAYLVLIPSKPEVLIQRRSNESAVWMVEFEGATP